MDIIQTPARELGESAQHVENVVRLLDEGNTLPSSPATVESNSSLSIAPQTLSCVFRKIFCTV